MRAGFGSIDIRSRRPYRVLDRRRFGVDSDLLLESVEVAAIKGPVPSDGPCVFAGETVIYVGDEEAFDDGCGHVVQRDVPLAVCRKTAGILRRLDLPPVFGPSASQNEESVPVRDKVSAGAIFGRRPVAQAAVRPVVVVLLPPRLQDVASFLESREVMLR